jgi:hypothetical protein
MVAIACIPVRIGDRHMKHASTTQRGKTVGGASCGGELSPRGRSSEMIKRRLHSRQSQGSHEVTDTASCESLRLHLVELGLGDRSRVEELFGRRDLIRTRAATARGDD